MAQKYEAADIEVLEGLEPVRKRPGMFIAGTSSAGLHQLAYEILDNSVDEAMNGHATQITVVLHKDGESLTVRDNGRGIPVDLHPKFKKPALEIILTTLHAGGKFSDKNYHTAGGLHGVGSSVVNALSSEMVARVWRDGKESTQSFSRGMPTSKLKTAKEGTRKRGTEIFFRPDAEIFDSIEFDSDQLRSTIQTKAYLNPGLEIAYIDEAKGSEETFRYEEGLVAYLKQLLEERKVSALGDELFAIERSNGAAISLALAWTEAPREEFFSFANGIYTPDGGSHEQGARLGIVRAVRNYMSVHDVQTKGVKISAEDIREGLICLVSVKLPAAKMQAQFQGQTKSKLNNADVQPLVENVARTLEQLLNEKPSVTQAIVQRMLLAAKAREASRVAVQTVRRKGGLQGRLMLPGKLADCSSSRPDDCELFLVEGDSAGGSTKQGRNRNFQAVLPLRGKVLNTMTSTGKKVAENKELANIIAALGCGVGEACRVDKLRYGKIVILTDADADGMHIATLLMAFFFQMMRPVIEKGHLFLGKSPLYGVFGPQRSVPAGEKTSRKGSTKGQNVRWAYSDEELEKFTSEKAGHSRIVRYKGLGEMNPETLWETTLDPKNRTLLRVRLEDASKAQGQLQELMGSDATYRSRLIQERAEGIEIDV